jgi:hypothetical protein
MTPVEIIVLLHCYFSAEPRNGLSHSLSHQGALDHWLRAGCIERDTGATFEAYHTTPRGDALVRMLKAVPLPVEELRYVNPNNGEIV